MSLRLVVVGTLAGNPYAGMAWMHMQFTEGLRRLGHDVYYIEATCNWPYDPIRQQKVADVEYAVPYLRRVAESFGLRGRWALRSSFSDHAWYGMDQGKAEEILASADAVFNVSAATRLLEERLPVRRWICLGTDPVVHELAYARGDRHVKVLVDEHHDVATYGENIGRPGCSVPPLPRLRAWTRQPVLMDLWTPHGPPGAAYTTVGNWKQVGMDTEFNGETYRWSKHHEFLRFVDLPSRIDPAHPIELALNLNDRKSLDEAHNEVVRAAGIEPGDRAMLENNGWLLTDALQFSTDPWKFRDYVTSSWAEFTVARDLNVRLRSGWFSERSANYLAAARPVITQNTGFGTVLPTGEGLFAFDTMDEILAAFDAINTNYERHSRAARELAGEYFASERVLPKLLSDLGM